MFVSYLPIFPVSGLLQRQNEVFCDRLYSKTRDERTWEKHSACELGEFLHVKRARLIHHTPVSCFPHVWTQRPPSARLSFHPGFESSIHLCPLLLSPVSSWLRTQDPPGTCTSSPRLPFPPRSTKNLDSLLSSHYPGGNLPPVRLGVERLWRTSVDRASYAGHPTVHLPRGPRVPTSIPRPRGPLLPTSIPWSRSPGLGVPTSIPPP
jgi:hypothetical protein